MIYRLQVGEHRTLIINARDVYSSEQIAVEKDEKFELVCAGKQRWKDWFISSGPDGYFNFFAGLWGLRVKPVKCFCLCGAYNKQDRGAFPVGSYCALTTAQPGNLSFFANDSKGFYFNNKGKVKLEVKRIA